MHTSSLWGLRAHFTPAKGPFHSHCASGVPFPFSVRASIHGSIIWTPAKFVYLNNMNTTSNLSFDGLTEESRHDHKNEVAGSVTFWTKPYQSNPVRRSFQMVLHLSILFFVLSTRHWGQITGDNSFPQAQRTKWHSFVTEHLLQAVLEDPLNCFYLILACFETLKFWN